VSTLLSSTREDLNCKWIIVSQGLQSGACGCLYLDTNHRVVAMHIYSTTEALPLKEAIVQSLAHLESKKRSAESTEAHCEVKEGLVLCKIRSFVMALRLMLNIDINPNLK